MKNLPNSKANLDRAIQRYAKTSVRANELRVAMANAIVAQMIGEGVVKGGSGASGMRRSEAHCQFCQLWMKRLRGLMN